METRARSPVVFDLRYRTLMTVHHKRPHFHSETDVNQWVATALDNTKQCTQSVGFDHIGSTKQVPRIPWTCPFPPDFLGISPTPPHTNRFRKNIFNTWWSIPKSLCHDPTDSNIWGWSSTRVNCRSCRRWQAPPAHAACSAQFSLFTLVQLALTCRTT